GPAGNIAARVLAEDNLDVIVLEKRQEIGSPKRCAEGINLRGLNAVGLEPNSKWINNRIRGAILYSPSGKGVRMEIEGIEGYILERKIFEKYLARDAIRAGAEYMVKTRVHGVIKEGEKVTGVRAEFMNEDLEFKSKIVIAADGVDSRIAKSAGIDSKNKLTDYHSGFQYEMCNLKLNDPDMLHIFFGTEIAPKGYLWIFPKDGDVANVGIGILGVESGDGKRAKDYLDRFIEEHPEIFKNSSPIEINSGGVPVSSGIDTFVADGFMIVGDAAQQVNPIHGGGIAIAMRSASIAADVAAGAIKEGNVSGERLYEYEKIWRETEGRKMEKLYRLRMFLEKLDDKDFEKLAEILEGRDIMELVEGRYKFLAKLFATKAPQMLALMKNF
ncbi:MAG TPA: NAD(P)/FAD-dependent oxidoreductase, partial [Candidatus Altiarchaeales archaeon]|nr:NAD(P)/FAD-dependent oxidoreductase [Candidatus Altiarchaeales archaeon]